MWRPAHGASTRPGPCRPQSGYGRTPGRPGPIGVPPPDAQVGPAWSTALDAFGAGEAAVAAETAETAETVADATAPVTP